MLCINRNLEVVEVELDARAVINVISNLNISNLFVHSLVDDCRLLASQIPRIHFKHYYCEANRCADRLARMGGTQGTALIFYDSPPKDLFNFIDFDLSNLYLTKLCLVNLIVP